MTCNCQNSSKGPVQGGGGGSVEFYKVRPYDSI